MPNTIIPIPLTGGVNLLDHPRRIADNEVVTAQNIVPVVPGVFRKRPAMSIAKSDFAFAGGTGAPINMIMSPFLGAVMGAMVLEDPGAFRFGLRALVAGADATTIGTFGNLYKPALIAWNNNIYCFPGYNGNATGYVIPSTSTGFDTSTFAFSGAGNVALRPRVVALYRGRFVYADFGPGHESSVVFADASEPDVIGDDALAANGRWFGVNRGDGDRVVAMVEIMQTVVGSAAESALLILKEHSAWLLTGEPEETDIAIDIFDSMKVSRISTDAGCSSAETVVNTPYGIFWAGHEDVWFFAQGQLPIRVGTKIRPALGYTPAPDRYRWHAAYLNGFYRLAVFSQGANTAAHNETTTGYNKPAPCDNQWWLDLRNGAPQDFRQAQWWGPQIYTGETTSGTPDPNLVIESGTYSMAPERRPGQPPALYTMGIEDSEYMYQIDGSNSIFDQDRLACPILFELLTKEYDLGEPMVGKLFQGAELDVRTNFETSIRWKYILNGGAVVSDEYSELCEIPAGFIVGVDQLGVTNLAQTSAAKLLSPGDLVRPVGQTVQLKLYDVMDEPTVTIEAGVSDSITVTCGDGAFEDYVATATLTPGTYTLSNFITYVASQLLAALNLAGAGVFTFTGSQTAAGYTQFTIGNGAWADPVFAFDTLNGSSDDSSVVVLGYLGVPHGTYLLGVPSGATTSLPNLDFGLASLEFSGFNLKLRLIPRRPA